MNIDSVAAIAQSFQIKGEVLAIHPFGDGLINKTYQVLSTHEGQTSYYTLQRINNHVFANVSGLMQNISLVTRELKVRIAEAGLKDFETIEVVLQKDGSLYRHEEAGEAEGYWRMYTFITEVFARSFATHPAELGAAARGFGTFAELLADFDASKLTETIPNFHNTPKRYERFCEVVASDSQGRAAMCADEIAFVHAHKDLINAVAPLIERGEIPMRITHNDTKINNVLLDDVTGEARAVIDLDTVMPGSMLYDFGDAIRSGATTAIEDEADLTKVQVDLKNFAAFAEGYLGVCGHKLTDKEWELLPIAGALLTFECGMRFLTDYLEGDVYFACKRPGHNLDRARNQFKLVSDSEQRIDEIRDIIASYRRTL